jgi:hypothetical protein
MADLPVFGVSLAFASAWSGIVDWSR